MSLSFVLNNQNTCTAVHFWFIAYLFWSKYAPPRFELGKFLLKPKTIFLAQGLKESITGQKI